MPLAVEVDNVARRFGRVQALAGVSLAVEEGEFFGLLGPNGAGKTTLISILAGLTRADARHGAHPRPRCRRATTALRAARWASSRRSSCSIPSSPCAKRSRSSRATSASANNGAWIDEILHHLDLTSKANANMRSLSGGMKRRVLVGQALVHKPPVIVLDEPTAGVDVELRQSLWGFIRKLNRDGHTIILTTHYLEEAEALCGRIAMLKAGKLVALDTKQNLLSRFAGLTVRLAAERVPAAGSRACCAATRSLRARPRPLRRPRGAARRAARRRASASTSSRCRRRISSRSSCGSWAPGRPRVRGGGAVIRIAGAGWLTLLYKELLRFWKVSFQTILAPVLTALLYLLIFSHVLEANVSVFGGKVAYTAFLVPGLVMMSVLQNAFANTSSSMIQSKITGNLIFILLPPLSPLDFFAAYVLGAMVRGLVVGLGVFARDAVLRRRRSSSCRIRSGRSPSRCSAARSSARWGSSAAIWAEKFDQLAAFQNFIIMPLTFLSGVFYSIHSLPPFWQALSTLNPFFYMIDGFRYGFFGLSDVPPATSLAIVAGVRARCCRSRRWRCCAAAGSCGLESVRRPRARRAALPLADRLPRNEVHPWSRPNPSGHRLPQASTASTSRCAATAITGRPDRERGVRGPVQGPPAPARLRARSATGCARRSTRCR